MKKTAIVILAAVLVLCIGATGAFAAGGWGGFGSNHHAGALTCPAADGSCPYGGLNCPNKNCPAGHYTDQDGDGICDNYGSYGAGQGQHHGHEAGHHGGCWN